MLAMFGSAHAQTPAVGDCEAASNYAGKEPSWYAAECLGQPNAAPRTARGVGSGSDAYMLSFGVFSDPNLTGVTTYPMPDINSSTPLAATSPTLFSGDFDQNSGVLYAVDNDTFSVGTVDLVSGAYTQNAPLTGTSAGTVTGLAWDPTSGDWYLTVGNELYSLDPDTGVATLIGDTGLTILIDIKFDETGQLYAVDIDDDSLYAVDKTDAASSLIGPLGFALNFAQGMAFDYGDNTMWMWMYQGGGNVDWGTIDLGTGAATSVQNFAGNGPEASGGILGGFSGLPESVPVPAFSAWSLLMLVLVISGVAVVTIRMR